MAANLDRAESALTAVSDIAYVRAIDSSGNSVRISKADLASVLGGFRFIDGTITDPNSVSESGWGYTTSPSSGLLLTFFITEDRRTQYYHTYAYQVFFRESFSINVKCRMKREETWSEWKDFSFNV